ncbi:MAG: hypothetical protein V4631_07605 [Pseudomonadota bacterium]
MTPPVKAVGLAAILAVAGWLAWPGDSTSPSITAPTPVAATPSPAAAAPSQGASMAFFSEPAATSQVSAAVSMAATRLHGDPEAPPIVRPTETRPVPSAAELADPKAYLAYEARQSVRLYASYVKAVDQELPILRADIARGQAIGIAPDKIAKAQDKARRLEALRAQLIKDHPELGQ